MTAGAHDRGAEARSGYGPCGRTPRSETGGALLSLLTTAPSTGWRGSTSTRRACSRRCWTTPAARAGSRPRFLRGHPPVPHRNQRSRTTYATETGTARVVDAMTFRGRRLGPGRELQRRVHGVTGSVPMAWRVQPRFCTGRTPPDWAGGRGSRWRLPAASRWRSARSGQGHRSSRPAPSGALRDRGGLERRWHCAAPTRSLWSSPRWPSWTSALRTRSRAGAPGRPPGPTTGLGGRRFCAARWRCCWCTPPRAVAAAATTSLPEQVGGGGQLGLPVLLDP